MAAATSFHRIFMGWPCVAFDDARALGLRERSGRAKTLFIKILRQRAATGNPSAIRALERFGP